ncbi:MAG: iron uptake porin, partial [Microcystaceae cyanobacterium]
MIKGFNHWLRWGVGSVGAGGFAVASQIAGGWLVPVWAGSEGNPITAFREGLAVSRSMGGQSKTSTSSVMALSSEVPSVSSLRDVSPQDWAYEALKSLVTRYGCIVGYPNLTFRGDRALTRWEFAAGLNACQNTLERLLKENVAVLQEDLDKLKRLVQDFQAELAQLGVRVDNLEARVSYLEDHQFSTTTKLN